MKKIICSLFILFLSVFDLHAQQVVINEVMPLNATTIADEDGDYSDWIELYNNGDTTLDLNGFRLSDDLDDSLKWVFPAFELEAHPHLLIFASGKDRKIWTAHWETVIPWGDEWKYCLGSDSLYGSWRYIDYDDDAWSVGPSGFGYGDNDDSTVVEQTISLYIRKVFQIEDLSSIQLALLHMDYDDAFVAYINGTEVARSNIGQSGIEPRYNQIADVSHEAQMYQGGLPEVFVIEPGETVFRQGQNVLAIQIHNTGATSSDLTAIPFLTLGMSKIPLNPQGVPDPINDMMPTFHTNFKINANGETLLLLDDSGHSLDIIEASTTAADISMGRKPDGGDQWVWFAEATPGSSNTTEGYEQTAEGPQFSVTGGLYTQGTVLYLSTSVPNASIHYTEDCSQPTAQSPVYSSPLLIDETKVVRARVYGSGYMPSSIITHTYLITENLSLPVVSLSTAPVNLWDDQYGIYAMGSNAEPEPPYYEANFWQDWERPIHIEFFDRDGTYLYSGSGGILIFGGWSRAKPQKSLALYARREYGPETFDYPFFPDKPIQSFQSLVLRNSGNDWGFSMFRDPLMQGLVKSTSLVVQAYRPVIVYLNGEYWGIYNLREKLNEHYIASNYGFDPNNLDILEYYEAVIQGESDHYLQMINYIISHDLSIPQNYDVVKVDMDVDNFIDYQVAQIYFDNTDWPGTNIKFFRPRTEYGLWRWLLFDTDACFGLYDDLAYMHNTLEFATDPDGPPFPNPPWSTLLIRHLLENIEFRNSFINRFADYMNTIFTPDEVIDHIDSLKIQIENEMENHFTKWGGYMSSWRNEVELMREFARHRKGYVQEHILDKFNLDSTHTLCLDVYPDKAGTITINTISPSGYPWEGTYFQKVPVLLNANPYYGFRFLKWEGDSTCDSTHLSVNLTSNFSLTAVFEPADMQIVINEINYHSSQDVDPEDWVELYNNSDFPVDLSGWKFKDSNDTHVYSIPDNTILNADAYIVLCRDLSAFGNVFPDVANVLGDLDFGFDGNGELLRLYDEGLTIVDSLTYDDRFPWPLEPDGNGPTLALKNPNLDNTIAENWTASDNHGTPGEINDVYTKVSEGLDAVALKEPCLFQNYPNPFNTSTRIRFNLNKSGPVTLKVYNVLGQEIEILFSGQKPAGEYVVQWQAEGLSSGLYLYRLKAGNFIETKKLLYQK
ncbi:MAG: CotH kinase family protein [bacterium]